MKTKRGQVTIFILIGLILLVAIGLFFVFQREKIGGPIFARISTAPVEQYVEECLNEVSVSGIYILANKGGHIYPYANSLITEENDVAYHLDVDKDISPRVSSMEQELSRFIEEALQVCIRNFEIFDYYDFEVKEIEAQSTISKDTVSVKLNFPITIQQKDTKESISDFSAEVPIRLGYIIDIKNELLSKIRSSETLDLGDFSSYSLEIGIMPFDKNNVIYSIHDKRSDINDAPLLFQFAVKNSFTENKVPFMEEIGDRVSYVNEEFYLKVIASDPEGKELAFEDETALFDINTMTGEIRFTPTPADKGMFYIPISVTDGFNEVSKTLTLNVTAR